MSLNSEDDISSSLNESPYGDVSVPVRGHDTMKKVYRNVFYFVIYKGNIHI